MDSRRMSWRGMHRFGLADTQCEKLGQQTFIAICAVLLCIDNYRSQAWSSIQVPLCTLSHRHVSGRRWLAVPDIYLVLIHRLY